MKKPNRLHLLNAGGQLPSDLADQIRAVAHEAFLRHTDRLGLEGVDAVFFVSPWTIPETGMVGNAPDGYSVHISMTPASPQFQENWRQELPATLAHELHHAGRWRACGLGTLLEALVFEGLAQHYEEEERGAPPIYARPISDLQTLWNQAQASMSGPYDHQAWFFGSEAQGLPRWSGYALGYELVRRFFQQHGGDAVIHAVTPADLFHSAWEAEG